MQISNRRVIPRFIVNFSHFSTWALITGIRPEGAISPAERELVHGYVKLLAYYGGHGDVMAELADSVSSR